MNAIGQDMVLEVTVEHHDGVIGDRTTDKDATSHRVLTDRTRLQNN